VAFSLGFEEEFLTLVRTLRAAGLPPLAAERSDTFPLVLAGGPLAFMNPAPVAPFVDLFWVGEAEAGLGSLVSTIKDHLFAGGSKSALLDAVKDLEGVYVPSRTAGAQRVRRAVASGPWAPGLPATVLASPGYSCFVSSETEFKDMLLVEVNRGCPYGCRFCAAGFVYRPPRQAALDDLKAIVERTGPPKVGLVGTALTDWPDLLPFLTWLKDRGVKFSLSSLRADGITREFMEFLRKAGLRTMTLALEAASRRLRLAANKKLREEDFLSAVRLASEFTVNHLKVYLIVGWPGETDQDYAELASFLDQVQEARREGQGRRNKGLDLITVSASSLTPKPWTPFQWAPMASERALQDRIEQIRRIIKPLKGFAFNADKPRMARRQALLSRGDERLAALLLAAAEPGVGLTRALKAWDGDPDWYLDRERGEDERFPWEVIDLGVERDYLWREWRRYKDGLASPKCPDAGCRGCRACGMYGWLEESGDRDAPDGA
jgi:radical SAM superfamily enzyme YgiQ (UPF0313 family)